MNSTYIETNRKLQYKIPGLVELQESFDNFQSTGTFSSSAYFENFKEYLNKNITLRDENTIDPAVYYYYNLHQSLGLDKNFQEQLIWLPNIHLQIDTEARTFINSIKSKSVAQEAITVLDLIQEQLLSYDPTALPSITAFELENGSLGLEWVIGHFRLGFNFELDSKDSGYFLISDRSAGEIRNYGNFNGLNKRTLIKSLLTQILEN